MPCLAALQHCRDISNQIRSAYLLTQGLTGGTSKVEVHITLLRIREIEALLHSLNKEISFQWIPGHISRKRNENTDEIVRTAS